MIFVGLLKLRWSEYIFIKQKHFFYHYIIIKRLIALSYNFLR